LAQAKAQARRVPPHSVALMLLGSGKEVRLLSGCLDASAEGGSGVQAVAVCPARRLHAVKRELEHATKDLQGAKVSAVYCAMPIARNREMLRQRRPHVLVGTPGRIVALAREGSLDLGRLGHLILDDSSQQPSQLEVQSGSPEYLQAQLLGKRRRASKAVVEAEHRSPSIAVALPQPGFHGGGKAAAAAAGEAAAGEVVAGSASGGATHLFSRLEERERDQALCQLLDALEFDQAAIYAKSAWQVVHVERLLAAGGFPVVATHSELLQEDRASRYGQFNRFEKRILVCMDLADSSLDSTRLDLVINYAAPESIEQYTSRCAGSDRFRAGGCVVTLAASEAECLLLKDVQQKLGVTIAATSQEGVA